jgi:hypothetical protein
LQGCESLRESKGLGGVLIAFGICSERLVFGARRADRCLPLEHIHKLFDGLEKVCVEAFADFFLRLFGIYRYALISDFSSF